MRGWTVARGRSAAPALRVPATTATVAILAAALVVRIPLLFGGQIDYDEGVYWQSLRSMAAGHELFTSVYSSQPPAFLLTLLPFQVLGGGTIAGDRLGVLLFAMAGLVAAWRIGAALGGPWTGVLALAVLAVDPLYLRQSVTLQADGPAVALGLIGVAFAAAARGRGGRSAAALAAAAGAALALAVMTKLFAVAAGPAIVVAMAANPQGRPLGSWLRPLAPRLGVAITAGAVVTGLLLLPFLGGLGPLWQQVIGYHLDARAVAVGGLDASDLPDLPFAIAGVAGAVVAVRRTPALAAVGITLTVTSLLLLAVQHPLWPHHAVLVTAPLALLAGGLGPVLADRRWAPAAALAVAVLGCGLAVASITSHETPDASRVAVVAALDAATQPDDLVVTDDPYTVAMANRSTPPELVDATRLRQTSGNLTAAQAEAITARPDVGAVLMATDRLNQLPGYQDWVAARFPTVEQLGGGRTLYVR